jgi:hypothetical protein
MNTPETLAAEGGIESCITAPNLIAIAGIAALAYVFYRGVRSVVSGK